MVTACSSSRSDRGLVRPDNQDHLLLLPEKGLYVVADGMGGAAEGARASEMVTAALAKAQGGKRFADRLDELNLALLRTNREIRSYAKSKHYAQMGSTVALVQLSDAAPNRAAVCHVGDSRVYRARGRRVEQLTQDHSVGRELFEKLGPQRGAGFLKRSHPLSHLLTRSVGVDLILEPEWRRIDIQKGDRLLICSDGLHDVIDNGELRDLLKDEDLEKAADALAARIRSRGAPDNYTFILLAITDKVAP